VARTIRTLALLVLAPPILLLGVAHLELGSTDWHWLTAFGGVALIAAVAIRTSGWATRAQLSVGAIYLLIAIPALPFLALVAECSTGNCL